MTLRMKMCGLVVLLAGCSDSAPSSKTEPGSASPAPPSAGPDGPAAEQKGESPEPSVAAASSGPSSPPPKDDAKAPDEAPPPDVAGGAAAGPLHVIARSGTWMKLHPLTDGTLLVSAGPLVMRVGPDKELIHDLTMFRGLAGIRGAGSPEESYEGVMAWGAVALGGRWPDAVYMSVDLITGFRGEGGVPDVYRWDGQAWARIKTDKPKFRWYPAEVHPWVDGSLLARRVFVPAYEMVVEEIGEVPESEIAAADRAIAKAKQIVVIRGAPKAPPMPPRVSTFASLSSGEIFAISGRNPSPEVVRIDATGVEHSVTLPGKGLEVRGLLADGTDRAWLYGALDGTEDRSPWIARVEGDTVTPVDAPPCKDDGISSLSVLPSGAQWATCGDDVEVLENFDTKSYALWHRPSGGAWAQRTLPAGITAPRRVFARADDDVWVAADDDGGGVILHSSPRSKVLELPDIPELGRQLHEWGDPEPIEQFCMFPYVPLRSPPADAKTVESTLDGPLGSRKSETDLVLVRTTIRKEEQLGIQLLLPDDPVKETAKVAALLRKTLGKELVGEPRCWVVEEAEEGGLARWESKAP